MICDQPFIAHNMREISSPVIISVPHAGRSYPQGIESELRVSLRDVQNLEDRYADQLVETCIQSGYTVVIAQVPRLIIDLNRASNDFDPVPRDIESTNYDAPQASRLARQGLGIVPTRLPHIGALWREPVTPDMIGDRIVAFHEPYHRLIATLLQRAHRRFGWAILLDLHSMPDLPCRTSFVLGDQHGQTASAPIRDQILQVIERSGHSVTLNTPYAGGFTVAHHGDPQARIDALQLEISRSLYLTPDFNGPSKNMPRIQRLLLDIISTLSGEYALDGWQEAAE